MTETSKDYLKPEFPEDGEFDLIWENGYVDGKFSHLDLTTTTHPGNPYALVGEGFPVVLRVLRQEGKVLYVEDALKENQYAIRIQPIHGDF